MIRWGLSATILAPAEEILRFAAYHIDAGAHRLYIFLDDANPQAYAALKAHPKVRVTTCDAAWWAKRGGRPAKHQVRQSVNATHAYNRKAEVDWLIHMDADEFLVSDTPVDAILDDLPAEVRTARTRPIEALAGDGTVFKGFIPNTPARDDIVQALYPVYGAYLKGGFLSHVAGKLFVRTGMEDISIRIHNAFQGEAMNPGQVELPRIDLAHMHARSWPDWIASYRYRLRQGSYRAELAPARARETGGRTLHELFRGIEAEAGETGLRAFYDEVCADTPQLRDRLSHRGLLRQVVLDLDAKRARHFPAATA
ncbi:glycosyltransferase family 2 protein [Sulfitobacter sabulilitoris]|uniref:glycosyltransferase family 2 protein n=1 Tax=Sulfitobacter sabulilitoris TaxID=2562655 RepID=UPI001FEC3551|nr:glycosyltransferase family 2 protein [Sulfitobacter sabulilitoris]